MAGVAVSGMLRECPALEELYLGEQEPEWVLAFMPSFLCESVWRRLTEPSYWELYTVAEYEAGEPCRDGWRTPHHPRWTEGLLARWTGGLLGFPVALERAVAEIRADRRGSRWHQVPLYLVRRNS